MVRPEKMSRTKAFNKAVRAQAAHENTSFKQVLERTQSVQGTRAYRSMLNLPTHPERTQRRNLTMMSGELVNKSLNVNNDTNNNNTRTTPTSSTILEDNENGYDEHYNVSNTNDNKTEIVIDLMAIAKPAKPKGIAKEFEVVQRVRDVIVLEDIPEGTSFGFGFPQEDDVDVDDWEAIEFEDGSKRTYSAALRGR